MDKKKICTISNDIFILDLSDIRTQNVYEHFCHKNTEV